jgi:RimJ/RimL family protein N-acetyltransferase
MVALLAGDTPDYRRYFQHFFDAYGRDPRRLARDIGAARRDRYWGLELEGGLAGFFMVRGLDEGFARPAFGVYVGQPHACRGLARFALDHALAWCRGEGIARVMLKVHRANERAYALYRAAGFRFDRVCPDTGQDMLELRLDADG